MDFLLYLAAVGIALLVLSFAFVLLSGFSIEEKYLKNKEKSAKRNCNVEKQDV